MIEQIASAVMSGEIPGEIKAKHKGFSEWNLEITSKNHQPIVQVAFLFSKLEHDFHDSLFILVHMEAFCQ